MKTLAILSMTEPGSDISLAQLVSWVRDQTSSTQHATVAVPLPDSVPVAPPRGGAGTVLGVASVWADAPVRLAPPDEFPGARVDHLDVHEDVAWDRFASGQPRFKAMHFWSRLGHLNVQEARARYQHHVKATEVWGPDALAYQQNFAREDSEDRWCDGVSELSWQNPWDMLHRPAPAPEVAELMAADTDSFLDRSTRTTLHVEERTVDRADG
jgi:hypothetical protein